MNTFFTILWGVFTLIVGFATMGWLLWRWLKRSDEPVMLIVRWGITAVIGALLLVTAAKANDEITKVFAVLLAAVCGIVFTLLWGSSFCGWVASLFTGMYDGGDQEVEPTPFYSLAEGKRKQGKYEEAITEVLKQLEKFPNDFPGWMLLAEIQAMDQQNVTGALETVDQLLAQEGHAPKNIAFALTRCADWELKFRKDPEAARHALQRIVEMLPDTEQAQIATQRIAHLADADFLAQQGKVTNIALRRFDDRLGLRSPPKPSAEAEEKPKADVAQLAAQYVQRLGEFPKDNETREKLAVVYAEQYQRLPLAEQELEQLITAPNQSPKQVVHWLNLMADLQVKYGEDPERARQTLRRITEMFPKSAFAENALNRIAYVNLEVRGKQEGQVVKLGIYEKNLGLK